MNMDSRKDGFETFDAGRAGERPSSWRKPASRGPTAKRGAGFGP